MTDIGRAGTGTDPHDVVAEYIDLFNTTEPARRGEATAALFTPDARYVDPNVDLAGPDQIDAFVAAVQQQFPGHRFTLGCGPDAHHDQLRITWHAGPPEATEPSYIGFDVLLHTAGRIRHVLGFIDKTPDS